ncbi:hypothetical protein NQ314_001791 [Rhamnusium bicolor]|uniref:Uncharacterized protein n=1 Tax=Rhamnusium bicolor TaxID=1586634 RepID=A0AAV8ZSY9_9CUCU|nr:hypothetical protein NQ314_001791 [Rhamnusium bicolor]
MFQQSRYRAEDSRHQEIASPLASSYYGNLYHNKLNGNDCEDRVLCELLVSASISKNSEEHIDNLLHAFSEQ